MIATGSAFAIRARGSKQVVVVFGGDGTYATPHFHSALNNAALLQLPFIYVLENNLYHQYAHYSYSCPMKDIAEAARTYRIPGVVVDGQDVIQVYNAARTAVERARAGEGPTLIEAKTYRYYNHWGAPGAKPGELGAFGYDPLAISSFRPEREVRAWMQRDPVDICRNVLISWGVIDRAQGRRDRGRGEEGSGRGLRVGGQAAHVQARGRPQERLRRGHGSRPAVRLRRAPWHARAGCTPSSKRCSSRCARTRTCSGSSSSPRRWRPPRASRSINLEKEFGRKRVVNTGIDEMWMAACTLGAGLAGSKAVTYIPYQGNCMCFQIIQNHAGKLRSMTGGMASMPIVFLLEMTGQTPGFAGQHSDYEIDTYYAHIPGVKTVMPSTPADAKGMMVSAIRDPDPVVYLYPAGLRELMEEVPDDQYTTPLDKAAVRTTGQRHHHRGLRRRHAGSAEGRPRP